MMGGHSRGDLWLRPRRWHVRNGSIIQTHRRRGTMESEKRVRGRAKWDAGMLTGRAGHERCWPRIGGRCESGVGNMLDKIIGPDPANDKTPIPKSKNSQTSIHIGRSTLRCPILPTLRCPALPCAALELSFAGSGPIIRHKRAENFKITMRASELPRTSSRLAVSLIGLQCRWRVYSLSDCLVGPFSRRRKAPPVSWPL